MLLIYTYLFTFESMPYKSDQQRKWAHTKSGIKALGKSKVAEFDKASKGKKNKK